MQLNIIAERNNNNKKEPSRWGSVLGTPLELAAGDGAGRCCSGVYKAVVVVGQRVRETRVREAVGAKKPKPSCGSSVWGALLKTSAGDNGGK